MSIIIYQYVIWVILITHSHSHSHKQWRSKGGQCGRSAPGGKIEAALENLERWGPGRFCWGKRDEERVVAERKTGFQEKGSSKFLEGGAANRRSAPGGRHPSYATARSHSVQCS